MNEETKKIAGMLLTVHASHIEMQEMIAGLNSILDRVDFREALVEPKCEEKKSREPQNLTEMIERLREAALTAKNELLIFQKRLDKLF